MITQILVARNMMAIHHVSGHFGHSAECRNVTVAFRDARLPLHPSIREYARLLLQKGVPGPSVYTQANAWAQVTHPPIKTAWDPHHRYIYLPHDRHHLPLPVPEIGKRDLLAIKAGRESPFLVP